ncbi:gamma interferon responsive lysosomal thiol reductase family protein [Tanacetum coccineum]|uniref:Gamma interferon responsive lysosomal thiol reductase family protein n=1 Tax=Tanacetum coccineum TaxID=301880 RepID=A0ABQ5DFG2_9ASTR
MVVYLTGSWCSRWCIELMPLEYKHMLEGPSLKVDLHTRAIAEGGVDFRITFVVLIIIIKGPKLLYEELDAFCGDYGMARSYCDDDKVKLSLYYEALCPYCSDFIVNLDLKLVPWGNTQLAPNNGWICQLSTFFARTANARLLRTNIYASVIPAREKETRSKRGARGSGRGSNEDSEGCMNDLDDDVRDGRDELADSEKMIGHCGGGDPLVFGRDGEEMDFLPKKGVQTKVIPGVISSDHHLAIGGSIPFEEALAARVSSNLH